MDRILLAPTGARMHLSGHTDVNANERGGEIYLSL